MFSKNRNDHFARGPECLHYMSACFVSVYDVKPCLVSCGSVFEKFLTNYGILLQKRQSISHSLFLTVFRWCMKHPTSLSPKYWMTLTNIPLNRFSSCCSSLAVIHLLRRVSLLSAILVVLVSADPFRILHAISFVSKFRTRFRYTVPLITSLSQISTI